MQKHSNHNAVDTTVEHKSLSRFTMGKTVLASAVALALLTSCSDSSDDAIDNAGDQNAPQTRDFAVSQNDGMTPGSVQFFSGGLGGVPSVLTTGANQGIAFDAFGRVYHNSDIDGMSGIRALGQAAQRMGASEYDQRRDRMIGSTAAKGITYVLNGDLLVASDVTDDGADIKIYASSAGAAAQPLFTIDTLAPVWDTFYDESTDRLYAAQTDGTLAVFDGFSTNPGATATRTITPVDENGVTVSINFHGVFVEGDTILVSDVGEASSPTDGALFTFVEDGAITGTTTAFTRIAGPATQLGNPVDAVLSGGSAVVAEKSNDQILVFDAIASLSGDVVPSSSIAFSKPESIEFTRIADSMQNDATDISDPATVSGIAVSLNPGPAQILETDTGQNSNVGLVRVLSSELTDASQFNAGSVEGVAGSQSFRTLENLQFDGAGNGYVVFDVTNGSEVSDRGIAVIHQLADRVDEGFSVDRDRIIAGPDAMLTSPKGIEIVGSMGAMIVADTGNDGTAATLQVYSTTAGSSVAPLFTVANTGDAAIWDIDYDASNDRLFAAGTAGDILVYDDFMGAGASAMPTRSIRSSTAASPSNMHGITYVAATDQLIVTDVGDAASAEDGKLYVIDSAMTASGTVLPGLTISGAESTMGNPVDLAFDGSTVYIAEKSNDALLVYRDVLALTGDLNVAPDDSVALTKPESVSLLAN